MEDLDLLAIQTRSFNLRTTNSRLTLRSIAQYSFSSAFEGISCNLDPVWITCPTTVYLPLNRDKKLGCSLMPT